MGDGFLLVTREQYAEMMIDESFRDASEMERGFMVWVQDHTTTWRKLGHSEEWIRQRIESARATRATHRIFKEQGLTMLEMRDALRKSYADYPQLYDLAVASRPELLRYRGDAWDLRQRYTLRVMLYEADKRAKAQFCRWRGLPVPSSDAPFFEQSDERVIRDLSTVEELGLLLAMREYMFQVFTGEILTSDQAAASMEAHGQQLRVAFISKHGYEPEQSLTPYIPVTTEGPQDHDDYFAKEFPRNLSGE